MRSLLFVPGDQERKLEKALASGADAVILDLEDAVAAEAKASARETVARILRAATRARPAPSVFVRINALASVHCDRDLATVMPARPDGIVLPKPRSGADVRRLSEAIDRAEETAGIAAGATRVIAIATEDPASLLNMASYIGASSRLIGLAWGSEDLSAAIGATASRDPSGALTSPFRLARDMCLMAAAAAGVTAIDEVHTDFRDHLGLARDAEAAARDGFSGKLAIHPDQVAVINSAFTPSPLEVARARDIVRLFADAAGAGVVTYAGRMLDRPHLVSAERLLRRARLAGLDVGS